MLWTCRQPDWAFATPWAAGYLCLSQLSSGSAGTGAAGVVREPGLAGQGGQGSAGEQTGDCENTAEPGRGSGLLQRNTNLDNLK